MSPEAESPQPEAAPPTAETPSPETPATQTPADAPAAEAPTPSTPATLTGGAADAPAADAPAADAPAAEAPAAEAPAAEAPAAEAPAAEAPEPEPAPDAAPPTPRHGEIVERLGKELGEGLVAHHYSPTEAWVRVTPESWLAAARVCKEELGLTYLGFIAGIDWKLAPDLGAEKLWDPDASAAAVVSDGPGNWTTGVAGGETRFQVLAQLADVVRHVALFLKVDAGDDAPRAESWVSLFRGADWHERETWEMYGIEFDGHPGLRHLYLPGEFEGFPLRKDFPLLAREVKPWPGLVNVEGLPGDDSPAEGETAGEEAEAS